MSNTLEIALFVFSFLTLGVFFFFFFCIFPLNFPTLVLHEYRTARQQLGTQIYMHGVVEKFGGDVASALRSSIPDFSNNSRVANSADFSERKSAESSVSKVGSYSGRLPPMPRTRGSSSRRSAGRSSSSRTVADILAEHAVRKKARQNAVAQ